MNKVMPVPADRKKIAIPVNIGKWNCVRVGMEPIVGEREGE